MIEILVYSADEVNEKVKKLEDVIEQLRKDLKKYGFHLSDCNLLILEKVNENISKTICTCGFEQALKER